MPGFNQRGPMNDGPVSGKGRGLCTGEFNPGQGVAGGYGEMGRGFGRRGGQARGWENSRRGFSWGNNRGGGRGRNFGPWAAPAQTVSVREILQERADLLEAELKEIKNQLNKLTES